MQLFTDDLRFPGMLHGALHFSAHPRAPVLSIDTAKALAAPGVVRVLTAADVPGERTVGMIVPDWPMYVAQGETTRTVADVLACVVAETREQARAAAALIRVEYEVLEPLTDMEQAEQSPIRVHESGNLLAVKTVRRGGDVDEALRCSDLRGHGDLPHGTHRTRLPGAGMRRGPAGPGHRRDSLLHPGPGHLPRPGRCGPGPRLAQGDGSGRPWWTAAELLAARRI
jgi:xanthine dehydrogenase molybdopterin-binding subunit B